MISDGIGYAIVRLENGPTVSGWVRHSGIQPIPDGLRRHAPSDEFLQRIGPTDWSIVSADSTVLRSLLPPNGSPIDEESFNNLVANGVIRIIE